MVPLLRVLNKIIDAVGWICIIAMLLMMCNVFIDVFVRYIVVDVFKHLDMYLFYDKYLHWLGGIGMQELEWHWFSIMFLMGLGYTLKENGHVRVDVFYDAFERRRQAWINIIGAIVFTIPFCLLVIFGDPAGDDVQGSIAFFKNSWESEESTGDPGSLPRLWPIKLVLPIAFSIVILSAVAVILKEALILRGYSEEEIK